MPTFDSWQQGDEHIESYAIIVTASNQQMSGIHNRMPVSIDARHWQQWLDENDKATLLSLTKSSNPKLNHYAITRDVNTSKNDREDLIPV